MAKKRVIQFAAWVATPCAEPRPRKPSVIIMCPMFTIRLAIATRRTRRAYHLQLPQRLRISGAGRLPTVSAKSSLLFLPPLSAELQPDVFAV